MADTTSSTPFGVVVGTTPEVTATASLKTVGKQGEQRVLLVTLTAVKEAPTFVSVAVPGALKPADATLSQNEGGDDVSGQLLMDGSNGQWECTPDTSDRVWLFSNDAPVTLPS